MDNKLIGVLLGVAGIVLWFMPLASWEQEFMRQTVIIHQAGHHLGGIAYLLLISSVAYATLSWFEQHQLRIIAGSIAIGISLLFFVQAGSAVAWGLRALIAVSGVSIWFAIADTKKAKKAKTDS